MDALKFVDDDRELVIGNALVRVDLSNALARRIKTDETNAANIKIRAQAFINGIRREV